MVTTWLYCRCRATKVQCWNRIRLGLLYIRGVRVLRCLSRFGTILLFCRSFVCLRKGIMADWTRGVRPLLGRASGRLGAQGRRAMSNMPTMTVFDRACKKRQRARAAMEPDR